MLKTSICASGIEDMDLFKRRLEIIKNAGFEAIDLNLYSDNARAVINKNDAEGYAYLLKSAVADAGLVIGQGHAPFNPRDYENQARAEGVVRDIWRVFPFCAVLGVPYLVCHPVRPRTFSDPLYDKWDELHKLNVEMYGPMVEEASKIGLVICTENIFTYDKGKTADGYTTYPKEMIRIMDDVPGLEFCFDAGHAALTGQDYGECVRAYGDRLKALHIHGNDGRIDLHNNMFELRVTDCDSLTDALAEIGYKGTMNVEIERFDLVPEELLPACYDYMNKCIRYLAAKVKDI